jgi:hypothetical protein
MMTARVDAETVPIGRSLGSGKLKQAQRRLYVPPALRLDMLLAGFLALATFLVHDVGYMFSHPFWTDEAWVAISTRLPLHQITRVTASTPIGWSALLRLVFFGGGERLRAVPLLFSALTVVAAYAYARSLPWPRLLINRLASVMAGVAALMMPSSLARDDLKQYTADAFFALVVLWAVSRLEAKWTRPRLITLAGVVVVAFFFSAVAVFVGVAAFGSVVLISVLRRNWDQTRQAAAVGAGCGALLLTTFLLVYRPGIPPGLHLYWAASYLPVEKGWVASWHYLATNGSKMATYLGMGPVLIALLLLIIGVVTMVRMRRPAVAMVVPALLAEMVVLGALKQYPLFDMRTSHFLTVAFGVTIVIGVGGLCQLAARVHRRLPVLVTVVALGLFFANGQVRSGIRSHPIANEDPRTATQYIAAHWRPGDVIVVGMNTNWGFAYYWPTGTPTTQSVTSNLQRFITVFPDQPRILVTPDRTATAVNATIVEAAKVARSTGSTGRIWVIHDRVISSELKAFQRSARAEHLASTSIFGHRLEVLTRMDSS